MAEAAEGRFCNSQIFRYLDCGEYPGDFDKNDKTALRKRAEFFCVKGTKLYYKAGSKLQH